MSIASEITRISNAVEEIKESVMAKGIAVSSSTKVDDLPALVSAISPDLQEKTVTPTTSQQVVTPDSGKDGLSKVIVNAMPTATQATPSISVSTAGLITASATQGAGYVSAGTKSETKQLTTQAAQTITPGTTDKTIASGRYLTGIQTIKGDSNLVPENIAEGVSIFGVSGTLASGGGGALSGTYTPASTSITIDIASIIGKSLPTTTGTSWVFTLGDITASDPIANTLIQLIITKQPHETTLKACYAYNLNGSATTRSGVFYDYAISDSFAPNSTKYFVAGRTYAWTYLEA